MERNKWEEEFKTRLDAREISPTPHAWERLDAMLNKSESKAPNRVGRSKWLYIAAGFAGFLLIATMYFRKGEAQNKQPIIVRSEAPVKTESKGDVPDIAPTDAANLTRIAQFPAEKSDDTQPVNRKKLRHVSPPKFRNQKQILVSVQPQNTESGIVEENEIRQEIVSASPVSERQIADIGPEIKSPKTVKIDARSLLSQVDGELEMSFREKVLRTVDKNYQNVKVALANRNNQE